ncbi:ATP-binding protein [Hydrogenophaga sp. 2FB]|uniref:ATP-binding protein n=1 Tax=Hydrogenophaga sp. 2FB TaxID=2502187 RepID=UPI001BB0F2E5|nr:ATP-binding protein [Hydrogenophaga sp. 2FB]
MAQPSVGFRGLLENRLDEISKLAEAFEKWATDARVPQATIRAVNLMLDELISNVVMYAYPASQRGEILVDAWISPGQLEVRLTDHAFAFNSLQARQPDVRADIDDRRIGGLGIHFVRQLADVVTYERTTEGGQEVNRVHIVKRYVPDSEH